MRKWLILSALGLAGVLSSGSRAAATWHCCPGPYYTSAAFPSACPAGWYAKAYYFAWYYPWYAYYNYSQGPYANWAVGGGFATYAWPPNQGHGSPYYYHGYGFSVADAARGTTTTPAVKSEPKEAKVSIALPADAKLLFNGRQSTGTGTARTFRTPTLQAGQSYAYELTAEIVRDGTMQTTTQRVVVRAGEETKVTLVPGGDVKTAAAK